MDNLVPVHRDVRRVHLVGEKLGFWVAGPICIYASTHKKLPQWLRAGLFISGVGTMVVDAWLLKQAQRNNP